MGGEEQEIERDDWDDGESRSISRMNTSRQPCTKMGGDERIESSIRRTIGMVVVEEARSTSTDASAGHGSLNDERTKILLDTCAYISYISDTFARKLRLRQLTINANKLMSKESEI